MYNLEILHENDNRCFIERQARKTSCTVQQMHLQIAFTLGRDKNDDSGILFTIFLLFQLQIKVILIKFTILFSNKSACPS